MKCPRCGSRLFSSADPFARGDCLNCGPLYVPMVTPEAAHAECHRPGTRRPYQMERVRCPECGGEFGLSGLPAHRAFRHRETRRATR